MNKPIEFFFDFISPYGWFAAERIGGIARAHARNVAWKPVLLGVTVKQVMGLPALLEQLFFLQRAANGDRQTPQSIFEHVIGDSALDAFHGRHLTQRSGDQDQPGLGGSELRQCPFGTVERPYTDALAGHEAQCQKAGGQRIDALGKFAPGPAHIVAW